MPQKVLITGATGFIGSHLVKACLAKGYEVRAFVMEGDPEEQRIADMGAIIRHGDLRNEPSVMQAAKGVDLIFHCAGLVTDWAPKYMFRQVILEGTENVCQAAHEDKVARLIYISTNDVFGQIEGPVINELYPFKQWSEPYPDFKIEAEKIVRYYFNEHGVPATMVYPCWVYGPGDKTFVPLLADAIVKKEMMFWRKDVLVWPTYIDNLIDLLMLLSEDDQAVGNGYLVHDGESTTLQQFCTDIANTMGVKSPTMHIPYSLVYFAAVVMEKIWKLFKIKQRPLLTTYAVKNLGSRFKYSIEKAERDLGWKPKVSFAEGKAKTMEWLKTIDLKELKQK